MRHFNTLAAALGAALLVAACGGGGDGNQAPAIKFTSMVSFGDSLSDVGSYKVGPIAASGGGMFNINGITGAIGTNPTPSYNWTQLIAAQVGLSSNACAARIGGYGVAPTAVAGCRNYAQGGSRVTDPKGVGNSVGVGFIGGPLTQPVVTQLANYAADNGSANFTDKQLVTVLAGGNDLFGLTDQLTAEATAAGGAAFAQSLVGQLLAGVPAANQAAAQGAIGLAVQTEAAKTGSTPTSIVTAAVTAAATHAAMNGYTNTAVANAAAIGAAAGAAGTAAGNAYAGTTGAAKAVAGMTTAGTTLAGYIKDQIVGKGAKYVVVVNVPDVSRTPDAQKHPTTVPLILNMTMAFNQALQAGLANTSGVLVVDAFAENQRQVNNPAHYALSNVTEIACDLTKTIAASSLVCTKDTLVTKDASGKAVTQDDVYHYLFADGVHPTPYGYKLLAQYVTKEMIRAGWL